MDKTQALQDFWGQFGLPAYQADAVPPEAALPYITYESATGKLGGMVGLTGSVWYCGTTWVHAARKAAEIGQHLEKEHVPIPLDGGGYLWLRQGTPFARLLGDPEDDRVRRVVLNLEAEFVTGA